MAKTPCNNLPSLSIDEIVQTEYDQEKEQELLKTFEKVLQEQGSDELKTLLDVPSHDFDSNQEIQLCPENSSLTLVSELGWSQLAPTLQGTTQPDFFDNGELAELVAAEDPSRALVSNLGWPDLIGEALVCNEKNAIGNALPLPVKDHCEQLLKLVAAEDPSVALVSDHGWPDTAVENNINSPRNSSSTSYQVHGDQTVTLTLPVVSATSLEQSRGQPLDVTLLSVADEASSFLEVNNRSPGTNNNSSPELQVANSPDRPSTNVGKTRPSVIVSRKRALIPAPKLALDLTVEDDLDDENQNGLSPAVLEKRRKGNARCKKYRNNK